MDLKSIQEYYHTIASAVPEFGARHSLESFCHTFYVLNSRYFGVTVGSDTKVALVPYADMCNTGPEAAENATWDYDADSGMFKLISCRSIKSGEAVSDFREISGAVDRD